jgi:hypothetical protein
VPNRDPAAAAEVIQRAYYTQTAHEYDDTHGVIEPEHNIALHYISALTAPLRIHSVLDVGCGTGRGVEYLNRCNPELRVMGLEPVEALLNVAAANGIRRSALVQGDACALPFPDAAFDAVMELGVLHHVPRPDLVVREMMRVCRKAIFISDGNLFGQGRIPLRVLKFLLYKTGLWGVVKKIQTRGRGYTITQGDGLAYSYSVYFQYRLLASWADRIMVTSLTTVAGSPPPPLDSGCVLLCAVRDRDLHAGTGTLPAKDKANDHSRNVNEARMAAVATAI